MARVGKRLAWSTAGSWTLTLGVWLLDAAGGSPPTVLAQAIAGVSLAMSAVLCCWLAPSLWRRGVAGSVPAGRLLLLLVLVSLAVRFVGIDWEVSGRYYRDEGIYYAAAQAINAGKLLPESFIYGHLPYYLYAVTLWIQGLFPAQIGWLSGLLFEVTKEVEVSWVLLRGVNALLGALTTVPVFLIARQVGGGLAAALGGGLVIFSPIYNEITRLIISDVPSAFFATMSLLFVARLLDGENRRSYLLAGVMAGFAAASKYPAGVVAVAIVAIWVYWRLQTRRWSWDLLWAATLSLVAFLAVMPAFWAHTGAAFAGQGRDLLFGLRQYGRGGWIGVMPGSNAVWYAGQLAASFGLPALALGIVGWLFLDRGRRRRWVLMLPFPLLFLGLLFAMSMVVKRNLLPVVPALAVLLGSGVAGWAALVERRLPVLSRAWIPALVLLSLALPLVRTTEQTLALARRSTRDLALAWIDRHLPRGAAIIQESYTPNLHYKKYTVRKSRFAARLSLEEVRDPQWDYLLLARNAYGRFLNPDNWTKPHHQIYAQRYREMLQFELGREFLPSRWRLGPSLAIYKIDPVDLTYHTEHRFAFEAGPFRYPREGAFLLLKEYFEPGSYSFVAETEPAAADGRLEVVTRDNRAAGSFPLRAGRATGSLPWRAKYFFYVYLPEGTEIHALTVARLQSPS